MGSGGNSPQSQEGSGALSPRFYAGEIRRVVDEKNRLTIPSRWRDKPATEFFTLPDLNAPCLKLVDGAHLRSMKQKLDDSDEFTPAQKKHFGRLWFSRATPCPVDKQGRIVIPPETQQRYRFEGEVVIIGDSECLEIWRAEDWEAAQDDAVVAKMAEALGF